MSRAYTADECRDQLLEHFRALCQYWTHQQLKEPQPTKDLLESLVFSMLNVFDGASMGIPAIDLRMAPHADDKQYRIKNGENYFESGLLINDCYLHDLWYNKEETKR